MQNRPEPRRALLLLDLINELVHPDGAYAHVCLDEATRRGTVPRASVALDRARAAGVPVAHVLLGYTPGYPDWPAGSDLFGLPDPAHSLTLGTWGTRPHDAVAPVPGEAIVHKRRISPFLGTHLDLLLRGMGVQELLLAGVATDLVVLAAAREGHDLGYRAVVLEDATATHHPEAHAAALTVIARTATVSSVDAALPVSQPAGSPA